MFTKESQRFLIQILSPCGEYVEIIVNGANRSGNFKDVAELLKEESLDPKLVVVEVNGKILAKDQYDQPLREGDAVEIVQFVAGG